MPSNKRLIQAAQKYELSLRDGKRDIYVSATAWLNVLQYVQVCFEVLNSLELSKTNRFFMHVEREWPVDIPTNFIQITAGVHKLGNELDYNENHRKVNKIITEHGASLVFSQHLNGSVLVLLYPYKSERYRVSEEHLLFKQFSSATQITQQDVEKAFAAFLRYSQATSCLTRKSIFDDIFRLRYRLKEWIHRWKFIGHVKDFLSLIKP